MTFKQKIIFIISLAFFQIFYFLSNYTGRYLNSFFFTDLPDCSYLMLQFISAFNAAFYKRKSRDRA